MIEIIDIGASPFEEPAPYEHLVSTGGAHVTGFEPHTAAFLALKADKYRDYFPHFIADGWKHKYYMHKASGFNSLFQLREGIERIFPEAKEQMELLGMNAVETTRLDELRLPCDLLKMDCQGSELMVMQNGHATIEGAVLIQLEVPLTSIYAGAPTLGDLDRELHRCGFEARNILSTHVASTGAVIDADMLYIRRELTEAQGQRVERILEGCYPKCRR